MSAKTLRIVRIYVTDADATDSSSDDDAPVPRDRVKKKHVTEIRIERDCNYANRMASAKKRPKKKVHMENSEEAAAVGEVRGGDPRYVGG